MRKGLSRVAAVCLAVAITAGCSGAEKKAGPDPEKPQKPPEVTSTPTLKSTDGQTLPITAYMMNAEQTTEIEKARTVLTSQCMKRFGFDFYEPASPFTRPPNQLQHRYDPTDATVAARDGYHAPGTGRGQVTGSPPPVPRRTYSPALLAVLGNGLGAPGPKGKGLPPEGIVNGQKVPPEGCAAEADQKILDAGGILQDSEPAVEINLSGYQRSMADDRVKEVFAKWSSCMKEKGFSYPSPPDALKDPRWASSHFPTPEETRTAATDAACKQQFNVIGVWFAVESGYENQAIQQNIEKLTQAVQALDKAVKFAGEVIKTDPRRGT